MIRYEESSRFKKDLKKLAKHFPSLRDDLRTVKKNVIELRHLLQIDNESTFEMPGFSTPSYSFWKIKKFACKSLKGKGNRSGIRVIYCYEKEKGLIIFIEIYYKGNKVNEDRTLIKDHINSL